MTTIAYHHEHKTIAVDSRITADDKICTDTFNKRIDRDSHTFVMCGETAHYDLLVESWFGEYTEEGDLNCESMVVDWSTGMAYEMDYRDGAIYKNELTYTTALGSGQDYALAAMDFGCSAEDAVYYASQRDCKTGGSVQTINIREEMD